VTTYIRQPDTGAYVAQWAQGFPPDDIMDWLRGAGVAPHTRVLHATGGRVEVHFDNADDAFMCWMAFSDDLVAKPTKSKPRMVRA
jgi:hypothetical protein